MSKFNTPSKARAVGSSPITGESVASGTTFNGGAGYSRDEKSELFLLGVSNFVSEKSFYESAATRDSRFAALARKVAVSDLPWAIQFVSWLRGEGNMRSASLVAALEGAFALNKAGIPGGRALVAAALSRADEPGEAIAYWHSNFGRKIPKSVKRGIADGAVKSFNQYSLGKYDTKSHGFRFGDVIELVHPTPKDDIQSALFGYALNRRRDAGVEVPQELSMLRNRSSFNALSSEDVRKAVAEGNLDLADTGLTWENLAGKGEMTAKAWEAVIPTMGYMALLRNLRNFEEAGVSQSVLDEVSDRLADPEQVAKSRQLPMRFLSAYQATAGSLEFGRALERALNASLRNVPSLKGKTLILVDRSGSMFGTRSTRSELTDADSAAIFGAALALRAEDATLVQFGSSSSEISFKKSDAVLPLLKKFGSLGGTSTTEAVRKHLRNHDRVIIITDEQAGGGWTWGYGGDPAKAVPAGVPLYTFNLVGYANGNTPDTKNRYTIGGGLTDASFRTIDLIERSRDSYWPWL